MIIQDADLEYSPEEYPELIELICQGRADVVYGSRFLGRHRVFLFTHYLGNRLLTLAHQRALQHDAHRHGDLLQGDADRGAAVDRRCESNGFGIEPELTAKIFKRGYRVYEVPITYDGRGYERGQEDHLARRRRRALGASPKYRFTE